MAIDLNRARAVLRLDADATSEDSLIEDLIESAKAHVEQHCDRKLVSGEPSGPEEMAMTPDVEQAILMLVAHWFNSREAAVVGTTSAQVELGFERLLMYRKRY